MKIGVYLGDSTPELGGGHTFEEEVCCSLATYTAAGEHQFVLLTRGEKASLAPIAGSMQVISLKRSFTSAISKRVAVESYKVTNRFRSERERRSLVTDTERMLAEQGIELVWSLNFNSPVQNIPYVPTVWDLQHRLQPIFPEVSTEGHWEARERHYAKTLRRATAVIAGTEAGAREIERFYGVPRERIWLLPHPTPRFALAAPAEMGSGVTSRYELPDDYLFYPAQFWPHKNHVAILRALAYLHDTYGEQLTVVLVGSDRGNLSFVKETVAKLSLMDQVRLLGFVSREDLVGLYRGALALVYPTYFGPENLPPLEAFALGCPVIASAVPGSEEQLAEAAVLFDPKDHVQLAERIRQVRINLKLRQELIERGRLRAKRFTGEDFVREAIANIDRLEPLRACWGTGIYKHL